MDIDCFHFRLHYAHLHFKKHPSNFNLSYNKGTIKHKEQRQKKMHNKKIEKTHKNNLMSLHALQALPFLSSQSNNRTEAIISRNHKFGRAIDKIPNLNQSENIKGH